MKVKRDVNQIQNKSSQMAVRLEPYIFIELKKLAVIRGETKSEFVQKAIKDRIEACKLN